AGGGKEIIADLGRYGTHIGTAFQIVDDILDYDGAESDIGKKPGDDLAEGKITLPVIHALENGSKEDVAVIREAILTDGASGFSGVVDILRKLDSLDYSRELAR
ncbi:MAG TPA: octaprenyl diphosphate synthase, partial [Betaproteobacteria bacterium]|nr:octaprenyl diphosphate synthase [Betaproteobacteria bacterium]